MCLIIDEKATKAYKKRHKNKKTVTVYKVVRLDDNNNRIVTEFRRTRVKAGEFKAGPIHKADPRLFSTYPTRIYSGAIHAYRKYFNIKKFNSVGNYYRKVYTLKCTAKMEDLIAVGSINTRDICFKKIFIPPEELEQAKKVLRARKKRREQENA